MDIQTDLIFPTNSITLNLLKNSSSGISWSSVFCFLLGGSSSACLASRGGGAGTGAIMGKPEGTAMSPGGPGGIPVK